MKPFIIILFAAVAVTLVISGCTSNQQQATPGNTVLPTNTYPSSTQVTASVPITNTANPGQPQVTDTTPPPNTYPLTPVPAQTYVGVPSPMVFPGTWYLQSILLQGASAPLDVSQYRITATFDNLGQVSGNSGCNNYEGPYSVTGQTTSSGSGIRIGPLSTTLMFCPDTSDTETMYMQILGSAVSYALFPGQTMSITDNLGNSLVYSSSPFLSQGSVPYY